MDDVEDGFLSAGGYESEWDVAYYCSDLPCRAVQVAGGSGHQVR